MKTTQYLKTVVCCLALAATNAGWALSPELPTFLYGTTTIVPISGVFALATTLPTANHSRGKYVAVARTEQDGRLQVEAWRDTGSSLESLPDRGVSKYKSVVSVAATGLNEDRVVTADVDVNGVLSIDTWAVGPTGVTLERSYRTADQTASSGEIAMTRLSSSRVVTGYSLLNPPNPNDILNLGVQAWTIAGDGLAAPLGVAAIGPPSLQGVSMATIDAHRVITITGNYLQQIYVNTWEVAGSGAAGLDEATIENVCEACEENFTYAVGAGQTVVGPPVAGPQLISSAFTPVLTYYNQLVVYYWGISSTGQLTLESTTPALGSYAYTSVAASMLPRNIPITSYGVSSGTGLGQLFIDWYTGIGFTNTAASYQGPQLSTVGVESAVEGTDLDDHRVFEPYHAYFVSAGRFDGSETSDTIDIRLLSYPEAPLI